MEDLRKRKNIRLQNFDYNTPGAYFITVCTLKRENYFWNTVGATIGRPQDVELSEYGKIADEAINNIPLIYPSLTVDNYVIMPDHIHLLLRICPDDLGRPMVAPTVSRVVNQLKGYVSKRIGISIWQKLFYDHVVRNRDDYNEINKYIYENPMRWQSDELYTEK